MHALRQTCRTFLLTSKAQCSRKFTISANMSELFYAGAQAHVAAQILIMLRMQLIFEGDVNSIECRCSFQSNSNQCIKIFLRKMFGMAESWDNEYRACEFA